MWWNVRRGREGRPLGHPRCASRQLRVCASWTAGPCEACQGTRADFGAGVRVQIQVVGGSSLAEIAGVAELPGASGAGVRECDLLTVPEAEDSLHNDSGA